MLITLLCSNWTAVATKLTTLEWKKWNCDKDRTRTSWAGTLPLLRLEANQQLRKQTGKQSPVAYLFIFFSSFSSIGRDHLSWQKICSACSASFVFCCSGGGVGGRRQKRNKKKDRQTSERVKHSSFLSDRRVKGKGKGKKEKEKRILTWSWFIRLIAQTRAKHFQCVLSVARKSKQRKGKEEKTRISR